MTRAVACILIMFFASSLSVMAQQKYGHIVGTDIMELMPEFKVMKASIERKQRQQENTMVSLYKQYEEGMILLSTHAYSLMPAIAEEKQLELMEIKAKIENLQQNAEAEVLQLQQKLTKPIIAKMEKAIDAVAKENGYTYIFDVSTPGIVVYHPEKEGDVTELVKKKMGL